MYDPVKSGNEMDQTTFHSDISISSSCLNLKKWKAGGKQVESKWKRVEKWKQKWKQRRETHTSAHRILDHRNFRRSSVCLGRCSLCGERSAVCYSDMERASICEGWYAGLLRKENWNDDIS